MPRDWSVWEPCFVTMLFGSSCCLPYFLHHCTYQINHCHWKKSGIYTVEDHTDLSSSHSYPRTERVSGETLLIRIVWVAVSQSSKGLSNVHNQEETYPKIIVIWNWYSYHDNLMDWLRNCRFNIPSKYAQQGMQSGRESHPLTHYCGNLTHRTLKQWKHFSVEGPTDENVTPKLEHP